MQTHTSDTTTMRARCDRHARAFLTTHRELRGELLIVQRGQASKLQAWAKICKLSCEETC